MLRGHQAQPSGELSTILELFGGADAGDRGIRRERTDWALIVLSLLVVVGKPDLSLPALGIAFTSEPEQAEPDTTFSCVFQILAWPDPLCDRIAVGTAFGLLEGNTVVATGKVLAIKPAIGA